MPRQLWIAPVIFEWDRFASSTNMLDVQTYRRAYDYWKRAEEILKNDSSDLARGDTIANLKRSLNHRLIRLEKLYRFSSLNVPAGPKRLLERLELFGLVRPFLLKSLMDIRNAFEHRDAKPPSIKRCQEFLDIMWYFLRSTDPLVQHQPTEVEYSRLTKSGTQNEYEFAIGTKYGKNPIISLAGWLPVDATRITAATGFLCLTINKMRTPDQVWNKEYHKNKLDTDRWVEGRLLDPNDLVIAFRAMLNTY